VPLPSGVAIHPVGPEGFPEAARLAGTVFQEEFGLPLADLLAREAETACRDFDGNRDLLLAAETAGSLVGTLLVLHDTPAPAPTAAVRWLAVDGSSRARGIGRELFGRAIETCRLRGIVRLRARCFATHPAALHLYWMHGFRVAELLQVTIDGAKKETLLFEKLLELPQAG
jgi:GNAT superfamily N-acetyltransferase